MNANRRLQERKPLERPVFCKIGGEEDGSVLNLSEGGLCFECLTPIEENDLLHLRLSVDRKSVIETTARLAWIDSARRSGGLRFLELSPAARDQIRAWLSDGPAVETPSTQQASPIGSDRADGARAAASGREHRRAFLAFLRKNDKQAEASAAENPVIRQEMCAPSLQLIPVERYRSETRWQFLRGVLVGFGISALVTIPILRYAGDAKPSPAQTIPAADSTGKSSADPTLASLPHPAPPSALPSQPAGERTAAEPKALETVYVHSRQGQHAQASAAGSSDPVTRSSAPLAMPRQAKAEPAFGTSQTRARARNQAAIPPVPGDLETHSSSAQAQRPRKVSATPQQLWSAVQAGNMKAAVALADLYAWGEGVPVNCEQARVLLLVASEKNNAEAPKKLQELDKGGCPAGSR